MRASKPIQMTLATAAVLAMSAAGAAPIANWTYEVTSAFDTSAAATTFVNSGTHPGPVNPNTGYWTSSSLLQWGAINGSIAAGTRSGLEISNSPANGAVTTNGAYVATNSYTHHNSADLGANSYTLSTTKIDSTLSLTSPTDQRQFATSYSVYFTETPNTNATCPSAPEATPCSDIFVLAGGFGSSFTVDGYLYTFQFISDPLFTQLTSAQCVAAGYQQGCFGFATPEGQDHTVDFKFRLVAMEVPEPATGALIGAGLLGVAGVRRRHLKKDGRP